MQRPAGQPGTPSTIRNINRRLVLELLRQGEPVSKTEIARRLGTTAPTAANAVNHLVRMGLVRPVRGGESTGGRRPTLLGFHSDAGYVVALSIGRDLEAGLFDLGGKVVARLRETAVPGSGERLLEASAKLIRRLAASVSIPHQLIWAIGISAPGIVDTESGTVSYAPLLGPGTWPLAEVFARRFSVPTMLENDVNAAALGERLLGAGRALDSFVYVLLGEGIGAGIILHGGLYRGDGYAAGEIGYMVVDPAWTGGDVGGFGCLESVASTHAVRRLVSEAAGRTPAALPETSSPGTVGELLQAATAGDEIARRLSDRVLCYVAMGVANVCAVLAPSAVILGGAHVDQGVLDEIDSRLGRMIPRVPPLLRSVLGEDASLVGAASLAIDHMLDAALEDSFSTSSCFSAGRIAGKDR